MYRKLKESKIQDLLDKVSNSKSRLELRKILRRVKVEPEKGCWFTKEDWSEYSSHRFVYKCLIGDLKFGYEICHKCDRKGCINPKHLFQGTHSDNMKDAIGKGRLNGIFIIKPSKELEELRKRDGWKKLERFCYASGPSG